MGRFQKRPHFNVIMNSDTTYKLVVSEPGLRPAILALLQENALPIVDLDEHKVLFACLINEELIGTGGLEFFTDCALVRSVSVRKDLQKRGLGKFIVDELEKITRQKAINQLYLLTTTAENFFNKMGYKVIDREDVPIEIRNTTEFSSVCPSTAVVMRKFLS